MRKWMVFFVTILIFLVAGSGYGMAASDGNSVSTQMIYKVTASSLNVRSTPKIAQNSIARIKRNEQVILLSKESKWGYIKMANGKTGYVDMGYLRFYKKVNIQSTNLGDASKPNNQNGESSKQSSPSSNKNDIYQVNLSSLNLRKAPDYQHKNIIGILNKGTEVKLIRRQGSWAYIDTRTKGQGYVSYQYLKLICQQSPNPQEGDGGKAPSNDDKKEEPIDKAKEEPSGNKTITVSIYKINASSLSLRKTPVVSSKNRIGNLKKGTQVKMLQQQGKWAYVETMDKKRGYVSSQYLSLVKKVQEQPVPPAPKPPVQESIVKTNTTYSYNRMISDIALLKKRYPDVIQVNIIGKSVQGRNIYAITVGKGKSQVMVNGAHHGREWITSMLIMKQIEDYAEKYTRNVNDGGYQVKSVLDNASISFVPMVNPDGVMLSQQGLESVLDTALKEQLKKINNGSSDFTLWKANSNGVDLNRQYPAEWEKVASPSQPNLQNYKGKNPLTEPEVVALYDYTNSYSFTASISYHSAGQLIYWYYGQDKATPEYNRDKDIAYGLKSITGYSLVDEKTSNLSGAGYKDWYIETYNRPGYTIEVGKTPGRPVPINEFDDIYSRNQYVAMYIASRGY